MGENIEQQMSDDHWAEIEKADNMPCPFCGHDIAISPLGHVWCDQCDYRVEIDTYIARPIEDALRARVEQAEAQAALADIDKIAGNLALMRAMERAARYKALLKDIEWNGTFCPVCGGRITKGHYQGCELAAALAE